jgi:hypothetical protein
LNLKKENDRIIFYFDNRAEELFFYNLIETAKSLVQNKEEEIKKVSKELVPFVKKINNVLRKEGDLNYSADFLEIDFLLYNLTNLLKEQEKTTFIKTIIFVSESILSFIKKEYERKK